MQRDEIGAAQQLVELDFFDAELDRALGRQERIVGDHLHLQPDRAVGDDRADIAAADDAERLAENLDAEEFVLLPFAGARRSVGLGNLPRQRQHQRDRVLGGGDRIAERRIHDDDAARGRRRNIDIVDADAGAADHFETFRLSSIFAVTLEAERMARPSKPLIAAASFSLSLPRLGWKSTSTPRSLKICTAAGDSASEMRTLGPWVFLSSPSPRGGSACGGRVGVSCAR